MLPGASLRFLSIKAIDGFKVQAALWQPETRPLRIIGSQNYQCAGRALFADVQFLALKRRWVGVAVIPEAIDGIRRRKSGSHRTPRWREMDSNFRFRAREATDLSFRFCLCP